MEKELSKRCIVMLSGGLDSRLAVKIMQEQGFEVLAVYFKLPFGCSCHKDVKEFVDDNKCKSEIFDCTKGELLQEYLGCLRKPKFGRGAGFNPCKDCKIFMFDKVREFANEKNIDLIVSGEVLGERPMSQMKKAMDLIEESSGLSGRLLRPLSAKLMSLTDAERNGLVDRDKLYKIEGRRREKQIELAKKFGIKYPEPSGGCLLCEKTLKNRFEKLLSLRLNDYEVMLTGIGRHFIFSSSEKDFSIWIILGRNEKENKIIEDVGEKVGEVIVSKTLGPSALIVGFPARPTQEEKEIKRKVLELIKAYSKEGSLEERKKFEKWKL